MPLRRRIHQIARHIVHHAQNWKSRIHQPDANRKISQTRNEIIRPIDRIDHPVSAVRIFRIKRDRLPRIRFLANDSILRKPLLESRHDKPLRSPIRLGDRLLVCRHVRLGQPLHLAIPLQDDLPRALWPTQSAYCRSCSIITRQDMQSSTRRNGKNKRPRKRKATKQIAK